MIWDDMIWYDMIEYDIIWFNIIQYDIIWYDLIYNMIYCKKNINIIVTMIMILILICICNYNWYINNYYQTKFGNQISNNMKKWKLQWGRSRIRKKFGCGKSQKGEDKR